jgi:hypothetical protein
MFTFRVGRRVRGRAQGQASMMRRLHSNGGQTVAFGMITGKSGVTSLKEDEINQRNYLRYRNDRNSKCPAN